MQNVQEEATKLIVAYSGDKAREIQDREAEVVNAWRNLQVWGKYVMMSMLYDLIKWKKMFLKVLNLSS